VRVEGLACRAAATEFCGVEMGIAVFWQIYKPSVEETNEVLVESADCEQRFCLINVFVIFTLITDQQIEMGEACSTYGERRGVYRVLVGKRERKRPLGRHRHRW